VPTRARPRYPCRDVRLWGDHDLVSISRWHPSVRRVEFGLRSGLSYIRSIEHEPGAPSQDLGTPLTSAETANINGRRILSTWAGKSIRQVNANRIMPGNGSTNNALFHYTHTAGKSEQVPGTPICMSGAVEHEYFRYFAGDSRKAREAETRQ
jgi:hypothetical protein